MLCVSSLVLVYLMQMCWLFVVPSPIVVGKVMGDMLLVY